MVAGPAARVAPAWAVGPRGAQAPASSSASRRAAGSGRGLCKGLHQPPALPAPGLPLPQLVKPAQRHPRPGRALGPGCHQRLPPATGLNGTPNCLPWGPLARRRRRACVPHSPRAACNAVRRARQPQDAGVYFHNFSVPTHFPSAAPEAEGKISEPTGDNPSRCLLLHPDPPLIPTSGASPRPQRSPLPRTTWQWRCREPRGGCPPCERGRGLSRGTQGLAQSRHQLLA